MLILQLILGVILLYSGVNTEIINFFPEKNVIEDPNVNSPTIDIIKRAGYPAESHIVQTKDGYLLTLHRIPRGNSSQPIMLQHGLLSSSADWVISGESLAFVLYNCGFDVWLGNSRGNTYSQSHVNMTTADPKYWNFSFHEMGIYDLPAVISYITNYKNNSMIYIGHSMGATMGYIMASEKPEVLKKVRFIISLAPVAFMNHMKSPLRLLAPYVDDVEFITRMIGMHEFLPQMEFIRLLDTYGCDLTTVNQEICESVFFAISGFDSEQLNRTWLPFILSHDPAGASTKTLIHYGQEIRSGRFCQYDYGHEKNMEIYNLSKPPDYDLSKLTVPHAFFYGDNDWLASPRDIQRLYRKIPNPAGLFRIDFPKFNHLDFLWAIDVKTLLYDRLIPLITKLNEN